LHAAHALTNSGGALRSSVTGSATERTAWLIITGDLWDAGAAFIDGAVAIIVAVISALFSGNITALTAGVHDTLVDQAITVIIKAITALFHTFKINPLIKLIT
jgi:hypothetical protein